MRKIVMEMLPWIEALQPLHVWRKAVTKKYPLLEAKGKKIIGVSQLEEHEYLGLY